jgi:flagellar basal-body rod modification protein FlgD
MEISAANGTGAASAAAGQARSAFSEDFDTFLTLLTAQVENQDPLAPLDSTQFVEQLATFSALEQQVTTNDHLEKIAALLAATIGERTIGGSEEG